MRYEAVIILAKNFKDVDKSHENKSVLDDDFRFEDLSRVAVSKYGAQGDKT